MITKFEVGKVYSNPVCLAMEYKVIARTDKFVTFENIGKKKIVVKNDIETIADKYYNARADCIFRTYEERMAEIKAIEEKKEEDARKIRLNVNLGDSTKDVEEIDIQKIMAFFIDNDIVNLAKYAKIIRTICVSLDNFGGSRCVILNFGNNVHVAVNIYSDDVIATTFESAILSMDRLSDGKCVISSKL